MKKIPMMRWTAALIPIMAASVASAQATLPAANGILEKYSTAIGGQAVLGARSIVTKGSMSMPAAGINATFEMTQVAPNHMSMVTEIAGMGTIEAGYDGTVAWSMDPMQGPRVLSGAELDQVRDESDFRGTVRSPEMFSSVETVADTTMNSERCYLVKLTWKSARETFDCFSPESGLIVASQSTQKTSMGDVPVLTLYNDYKKFGSITVPTKTTQEAMGQQQILTVVSVDVGNSGVTVTQPAAIQALTKPAK